MPFRMPAGQSAATTGAHHGPVLPVAQAEVSGNQAELAGSRSAAITADVQFVDATSQQGAEGAAVTCSVRATSEPVAPTAEAGVSVVAVFSAPSN